MIIDNFNGSEQQKSIYIESPKKIKGLEIYWQVTQHAIRPKLHKID